MKLIYHQIVKRYVFGLYKPIKSNEIFEKVQETKKIIKSSKPKQKAPTSNPIASSPKHDTDTNYMNTANLMEAIAEDVRDEKEWHADYKFVDKVIVEARGGRGGNGCISFEMPVPGKKIPSGGSGGRGGDVYIIADKSLVSLNFQTFHFHAKDGSHGKGEGMTGKKGEDVFIRVPLGTIVSDSLHVSNTSKSKNPDTIEGFDDVDAEEFEEESKWKALEDEIKQEEERDKNNGDATIKKKTMVKESNAGGMIEIDHEDDIVLVAAGGSPGIGNKSMRGTLSRQKKSMPATNNPGQPGQSRSIHLELKLIADVGLVGYPNAGKSSLLRVLSNARPKVAAYAFTTLHPSIGIVDYSDLERITVADIPGLIDGAHRGRGLGHDFLRHIERTKILLIVVDISGSDDRLPDRDLKHLLRELKSYNTNLIRKPMLIFGNKNDLEVNASHLRMLRYTAKKYGIRVICGSTSSMDGIADLAVELRKMKESSEKTIAQPLSEAPIGVLSPSKRITRRKRTLLRN